MKLQIFIDGWCPNCRRFSSFIQRIDFWNQIEIKNIRLDNDLKINDKLAIKSMAAIDAYGNPIYGFLSIYELCKTLYLLWLVLPFFYALKITGLGPLLYRELAIRRKIIPLHCDESRCNL